MFCAKKQSDTSPSSLGPPVPYKDITQCKGIVKVHSNSAGQEGECLTIRIKKVLKVLWCCWCQPSRHICKIMKADHEGGEGFTLRQQSGTGPRGCSAGWACVPIKAQCMHIKVRHTCRIMKALKVLHCANTRGLVPGAATRGELSPAMVVPTSLHMRAPNYG
eukprot:scaffold165254_cov24-Tisochrysis_lutea.AAC.1